MFNKKSHGIFFTEIENKIVELQRIRTTNSTDFFIPGQFSKRSFIFHPVFMSIEIETYLVGFIHEEEIFLNGVLVKWNSIPNPVIELGTHVKSTLDSEVDSEHAAFLSYETDFTYGDPCDQAAGATIAFESNDVNIFLKQKRNHKMNCKWTVLFERQTMFNIAVETMNINTPNESDCNYRLLIFTDNRQVFVACNEVHSLTNLFGGDRVEIFYETTGKKIDLI